MKTVEYLDAVKAKLMLPSDYAARAPLGVTKQTISRYRSGKGTFDNAVALRVAAILGVRPLQVIADMELERQVAGEVHDFWKSVARRVALVAGVALTWWALLHGAGADLTLRELSFSAYSLFAVPEAVLIHIVQSLILAALVAMLTRITLQRGRWWPGAL